MSIWKKPISLQALNATSQNTLMEHLNIQYTDFGDDTLSATMPVASITHQPLGLLHGGASVVLAESLGSLAANMCVGDNQYCVGLEINANHVKAARSGVVTGTAKPVHIGGQTQIWSIEIVNEQDQLVCTSRLTVMVRTKEATQ